MTDLKQIQQYFLANNIYQITQQDSGNLLITFDAGSDGNSSQTITVEEQLNETDSQKKTTWQKFKSYLSKNNKSSFNKQELVTMISDLQKNNPNSEEPTNWTPYLVGGGIIVVLGIVIAYLSLGNKKKTAKGI